MKDSFALALASDIRDFLLIYGKKAADAPTEWSSPDASEMEAAATQLENCDRLIRVPWSEWGSGGYGPYTSSAGRERHDRLLKSCIQYVGIK